MRIHPKKFHRPVEVAPLYRANQQILAPEVRVIDENGLNLGVMPVMQAVGIAQERGYDLVEVDPRPQPPIAKILNLGQFKYEREREMRKQKAKAKQVEVKGIRLSPRIGAHDLETRMRLAEKFLDEGDKLRIEIILRGRERAHADLAKGVIASFVNQLQQKFPLTVEQPIQAQGGQLTTIVGKK
jgi:translation initiation factor IF-3